MLSLIQIKLKISKINANSYKTQFLVPGYEKLIANRPEKCSEANSNKIEIETGIDIASCRRNCESEPECRFFFFNSNNDCILYKSCIERQEASNTGSTYQKVQGKKDIFKTL